MKKVILSISAMLFAGLGFAQNVSDVDQTGALNGALVVQVGSNNSDVDQIGIANLAIVGQVGSGNESTVYQLGAG